MKTQDIMTAIQVIGTYIATASLIGVAVLLFCIGKALVRRIMGTEEDNHLRHMGWREDEISGLKSARAWEAEHDIKNQKP